MKIEENVEMPVQVPKLPLDQMQIGASLFVPVKTTKEINVVRQRVSRYHQKNPATHWKTITVPGGIRIFRIEDWDENDQSIQSS
tara:strand:+ start:443 stop:694 length:252 start_codon:yes stop_codon:yes gene_type:complete